LFSQGSQHRAQIDQITQAEGVMDYNARRQSTRCGVSDLRYGDLFLEYQVALFVVIAWLCLRLSKIDAARGFGYNLLSVFNAINIGEKR
jgi:hypothetical protein